MDNPFEEFFGKGFGAGGVIDKTVYRCVRCSYPLQKILVKTEESYKKLFYCKTKTCDRFGFITVVAKK